MGLYPLPGLKNLIKRLPIAHKPKNKILEREQDIAPSRVRNSVASEVLAHAQSFSKKLKLKRILQNLITQLVHNHFSVQASYELFRYSPDIYHYRCAFGLGSLKVAEKLNAIKLCDHSIAHPFHIQFLIDNNGHLPASSASDSAQFKESSLACMKRDLDDADHIVVNSFFVKRSLEAAGISSSRITVIELCVDQRIMQYSISGFDLRPKLDSSSLMYAGGWIERKGVVPLAQAVELLKGNVKLRIAGASKDNVNSLCSEHRVNTEFLQPLGYLSRKDLAQELLRSQIFVFPSFCEGYAKVIQEAMVCGCYIIATENSGFSLFPGAHGTLVRPGDPEQLAQAISGAIANPLLNEYCKQNREVALQRFSSKRYGDKMINLYQRLLHKSTH
ncbi:glycosyltransferase family 4 protein [Synechococcus sp. BA-132 BA5]|uniref:glycosyltransferase family 4 protein n=1 Tax=Synechococcus sp. BA-132 BA5 TaxID=3110252 RepID=UPI002B1F2F84|nr:glycosyltransferase family 4 protein [Synechococcus sp. BA-132 BA5]MEA5413975.1 glycosyltransferase family 4 protein [Synechococcus sp. BA-132 BA5]